MILIRFGKWSSAAGRWFHWERIYRKGYKWTPFVRVSRRHVSHGQAAPTAEVVPEFDLMTLAFRCPKCGQAHKMPYRNTFHLAMTPSMDKVLLVVKDEPIFAGEPNYDLYLDEVKEHDYTNVVVCPECTEATAGMRWFDAFKNPDRYFEFDVICHCGGEMCMQQIPGSNKFGYVCEEDECRWVDPRKRVSGAEGDLL